MMFKERFLGNERRMIERIEVIDISNKKNI